MFKPLLYPETFFPLTQNSHPQEFPQIIANKQHVIILTTLGQYIAIKSTYWTKCLPPGSPICIIIIYLC